MGEDIMTSLLFSHLWCFECGAAAGKEVEEITEKEKKRAHHGR
jgi:hypothetical protein